MTDPPQPAPGGAANSGSPANPLLPPPVPAAPPPSAGPAGAGPPPGSGPPRGAGWPQGTGPAATAPPAYPAGFPPSMASTASTAQAPGFRPAAVGGGALPSDPFGPPTRDVGSAARSTARRVASGQSPLWYLLTSVGLYAAAFFAFIAALRAGLDTEGGDADGGAALGALLGLFLLLAGMIVAFFWIRQIGVNSGYFGGGLVFGALIPWEQLPLIGFEDDTNLTSLRVRMVMSLIFGLGALLLIRRPLIMGTWRAGSLPAPVVGESIWILALLGWLCTAGTRAWSYFDPVERQIGFSTRYTFEVANPTVMAVGLVFSIVAALMGFVMVITVTFVQHGEISRARRQLYV